MEHTKESPIQVIQITAKVNKKLDDEINFFLDSNHGIELLDIKFNANTKLNNAGQATALIIFKRYK